MVTQEAVHWIVLEEVDSTNRYLTQQISAGRLSPPVCVRAKRQYAGRGRAGRSWLSEGGLSMTLALPLDASKLPFLPLLAGLAVARAVERLGVRASLKWPNDVLVGGRKLAGVLCEAFHTGSGLPVCLVGIGVNVMPVALPQDFAGLPPAALAELIDLNSPINDSSPGLLDIDSLAQHVVTQLLELLEQALRDAGREALGQFHAKDAWLGKPLAVQEAGETVLSGIAMGVNAQGHYLLDTSDGLKAVMAGDLSLRVQA